MKRLHSQLQSVKKDLFPTAFGSVICCRSSEARIFLTPSDPLLNFVVMPNSRELQQVVRCRGFFTNILLFLLVSSLGIITYVEVRVSFCLHCGLHKDLKPVTLASLCFHTHKWHTNVCSPSNNRVNTAPLWPEPNC